MIDTWPLQQGIYAALTAAPAPYPVYDAVPQHSQFPYLVIGEFTGEPDLDLDFASIDLTVNLHAWSRNGGKKETQELLAFARARLDAQVIDGAWACTEDFLEILEDRTSTEDARVYHGVARYRVRASLDSDAPVPPPLGGGLVAAHPDFPGYVTFADAGAPVALLVDDPAFPGFVSPDTGAAVADADVVITAGYAELQRI